MRYFSMLYAADGQTLRAGHRRARLPCLFDSHDAAFCYTPDRPRSFTPFITRRETTGHISDFLEGWFCATAISVMTACHARYNTDTADSRADCRYS